MSATFSRREFLAASAGLMAAVPSGTTLVHEHVLVEFGGVEQVTPRYRIDEVAGVVKPHLDEIVRLGCRRMLECTPNYLGRDPKLLQRLSAETGLEIWTNTGIYGAAKRKGVPKYAYSETAEQLARRWIGEARLGVDGMKPRFIKTGVEARPLEEIDRKLVRAAAITCRETGLAIASHTGSGQQALEELEIVAAEKVSPSKFIWVHASSENDHGFHEKAARAGAWLEFDSLRPSEQSLNAMLDNLRWAEGRGLLGQVLISSDAGWYRPGEQGGGEYATHAYLYTHLLPRLTPAQVRTLMIDNPEKAFGLPDA